jgi:hypothetical protein
MPRSYYPLRNINRDHGKQYNAFLIEELPTCTGGMIENDKDFRTKSATKESNGMQSSWFALSPKETYHTLLSSITTLLAAQSRI